MKASLQNRIAPMVPQPSKDLNTKPVKEIDTGSSENKVDFLKLLRNSNAEVKKEREAQSNGDLSDAKSYDEFLEKMNSKAKKLREPKNDLDKDDFLKLFVAQLQHQDPLNPEESTEMASRLAHFNSLEQMLNVNKTLDKMLGAQQKTQSVNLVNYVGKEVTVDGGRIKYDGQKTTESSFELARPATNTVVEIRDGSGTVIHTQAMGTLNAGDHKFQWDGKNKAGEYAPNGAYTYSVVAKGVNDEDIPVTIVSHAKITGVDLQNKDGGVYTDLGVIKLDDIKSIGDAGFIKDKQEAEKAQKSASEAGANPLQAPAVAQAPVAEPQNQPAIRGPQPLAANNKEMAPASPLKPATDAPESIPPELLEQVTRDLSMGPSSPQIPET